MINVIKDISILTTIPEQTIHHLVDISIDSIACSIRDGLDLGNQTCSIDLGVGTLCVLVSDDSIKYKFIPSKKLMDATKKAISNEQMDLETRLENKVRKRIQLAYKDLL